jgi:hypothetical protein
LLSLSILSHYEQVYEESPAALAGLVAGDRVIAIGAVDASAVASQARSKNIILALAQ